MNCSICGKPIEKSQSCYRWVSGWERERGTGEGVHPLMGREIHGPKAHKLCVDIELRGAPKPKQESFLV